MSLKVLHVIPTLEGGGAERQLSMLLVEQSRRGWMVHVGIRRGGVHEGVLHAMGVHVHKLGDFRGANPRLLFNVNSLIKRIDPDIIQTWLPQMDIVGGVAAIINSARWIVSERSSAGAYNNKLRSWIRITLARQADAIVANSTGGAEYWQGKLPGRVPIEVIPNAIDVAAIHDAVLNTSSSTSSNNMDSQVLVVGRLISVKAVDVIIKAIQLVPDFHNIRVSVIGEGPLKPVLEELIAELGLGQRIKIEPYRTDWWGLFKHAKLLISMSRYEGHPNVVLETMAARCPLIVSDISAHRAFLDDDSAIFVPPEEPESLAQAIIHIISDPVSAKKRSEQAFCYANKYTVQRAANSLESVYAKAISGGRY